MSDLYIHLKKLRKIIYTSVMFEKVEDIDKIEDNK